MPEHHPRKRWSQVDLAASPGRSVTARYAELHCCTNFSFLEGASHPDELAIRAAELGHAALAVTDRNTLAGIVRAHVAAKEAGLKLLVGAAITPVDAPPVLLWVTDRGAYSRLCRLLTRGRCAAPKGACHLTFDDVAAHATGLLAGVLLHQATVDDLRRYRAVFADRCYAVAELHRGPEDRRLLQAMKHKAQNAHVPLVAANDVHYHVAERRPLQDVLTAICHGCAVAELGERIFPNAERHLKSPAEMAELFADCPQAVGRTLEVAERCTFSLDELRYDYPEELSPPGLTPSEFLARLTWEGAGRRYADDVPDKARRQIEYELRLIADMRYEAYFLTVWDLVRFARGRGILCQGRGSAANSAVCFCLGVTEVDPDRIDLLFERFISKERNEAPDIDVDFEHERREEVIQYIYQKYGRDRAGMTAEIITYQMRSAVRDVGKALGLSLDRVDQLARATDHHHDKDRLANRFAEAGFSIESDLGRRLLELIRQILDFPRHLSQHVGGLVITHGPLCELVPIENAAMPERTVIQWDKNDLDALGILKVDCLALGMLTAIRKCFDLIATHRGRAWTLATVPAEDPAVYAMIGQADTVGVFQIESRAQMSMLPRLRPCCFYDLVIEVAIVRPGPIQGNMVHPYLRRRRGDEPVDYPDERVRTVLEKTLGVPIFQEQAMRLVVVAAGFTPGEADQLRRAMGAWRRRGVMERFRDKLIAGMLANGYARQFADQVFRQIQGFGEYGFPESHAASFALLVYVSAWLKCYYPAAFTAALLNSQPMGFYSPAQLVADAKRHGVEVRPVDINFSQGDCTLESTKPLAPGTDDDSRKKDQALRLGFNMVRGLSQVDIKAILASRAGRLFGSFDDFQARTGLSNKALKQLAQADAFGSVSLKRRAVLWQSLPSREPLPLFPSASLDEPPATLPPMTTLQEVLADYHFVGLSLRQHPIAFLRRRFDQLGVTPANRLVMAANGSRLKVAGIVVLRQRPGTARGVTFVTLEDETGLINLIVRKPVWERYRRVARAASIMLAHGPLQRDGQVLHVVVSRLEDFSSALGALHTSSRDFR
jgi:error-prone DNA polymerase